MSEKAVAIAPKSPKQAKPKASKPKATNDAVAKPSNPTYFNMIVGAIRELKEPHGSSRQAIIKFIVDKYKVDVKLAGLRCRMAIKKSLADGKLKHGKSEWSTKISSLNTHTHLILNYCT
jgi:histone H1/5